MFSFNIQCFMMIFKPDLTTSICFSFCRVQTKLKAIYQICLSTEFITATRPYPGICTAICNVSRGGLVTVGTVYMHTQFQWLTVLNHGPWEVWTQAVLNQKKSMIHRAWNNLYCADKHNIFAFFGFFSKPKPQDSVMVCFVFVFFPIVHHIQTPKTPQCHFNEPLKPCTLIFLM